MWTLSTWFLRFSFLVNSLRQAEHLKILLRLFSASAAAVNEPLPVILSWPSVSSLSNNSYCCESSSYYKMCPSSLSLFWSLLLEISLRTIKFYYSFLVLLLGEPREFLFLRPVSYCEDLYSIFKKFFSIKFGCTSIFLIPLLALTAT